MNVLGSLNKQAVLERIDVKAYFTSQVSSIKWQGNGEGLGLCPFHADDKPSFSVNATTGLFYCHACQTKGGLFTFHMKKHGMSFKQAIEDLERLAGLSKKGGKRIAATYNYTDESGNLLFQTVRYDPKDFRQRRPDGNGGWMWDLEGVRLVPYNLPAILKTESVIIVEGEKDVETLRGLGFVATCNPMGAGKWKEEYNQYFEGKRVAILPDNDTPGLDHALKVARNLQAVAEWVKIVELPGLPEKGDVTDWIRAGGTKERLIEIIKETPEGDLSSCPDIYSSGQLDNSIPEPFFYLKKGSDLGQLDIAIEWVIDRLLPKQSITLLHGKGGIGKTWISLALSDAISRGIPFMGLNTQRMDCIFVDFENSLPVLVDRVRKIGIKEVLFWHAANETKKPPRLDHKEWEIYKTLPAGSLLIFDTLRASQSQDENDSKHMALVMSRLKELRDIGFTIILLHHTPKSNDKTYKGSTAIFDLADHVLSLHKVKRNNPDGGEIEDDEEVDCLYRFGTRDKTRYEPFHIFMAFDRQKGFVEAIDPDEETLQAMHEILEAKGTLTQRQIFETVKEELNLKSKAKVCSLLRKGEGKFWTSHKANRAIYYEPVQVSRYIYSRTLGQIDKNNTKPFDNKDYLSVQNFGEKSDLSGQIMGENDIVQTDTISENSQSLDSSQLSNCPGGIQTDRTDEVIEVLDISEVIL